MTDTTTLTLTDFLLARIADIEQQLQHDGACDCAVAGMPLEHGGLCPSLLMAQCRAIRKIVEGMEPYGPIDDLCAPEILGILAEPYADHPDYREEWRPQ